MLSDFSPLADLIELIVTPYCCDILYRESPGLTVCVVFASTCWEVSASESTDTATATTADLTACFSNN